MQKLSTWILKMAGWKAFVTLEEPKKSVICVAPHTSNWDFLVGELSYWSLGRKSSFLIKKSWFFFPFNYIFTALGGVPVDRSKRNSVTQQMVEEFNKRESFHLAITPEGTRELNRKWKAGFHTIAKATGATVYLGFFDFGRKEVGWQETFELTDDADADIRRMKAYYRNRGVVGKHPEWFSVED